MPDVAVIRQKYLALRDALDERARRLWAATEARAAGRGGFTAVLQATGMSSKTLARGIGELDSSDKLPSNRVRRSGGGRKAAKTLDPGLAVALEELVEPVTRGDPESPLRWTCKSLRRLSEELRAQGYQASHTLVGQLLHEAGYSLQANRKTHEGTHHPDRNAQFEHISRRVKRQLKRHAPVISVDTKKKELVGDFKNGGQEWRPKGDPEKVRVHDFLDREKGKAIPYGVYDVGANKGWVSVGVDHDTAAFAVNTIRRWWRNMGQRIYARADSLLITADGGGSNGVRVRLWKWELQKLADDTGLTVHVCHLPPGTSKWNKIEHRMFSFISKNWRGKPLFTHATIVNLISATRTRQGLTVRCVLDRKKYPKKIKVTDEQMQTLRLTPDRFHGDWNYTIRPRLQ
ncbi:MAG: ISAzo13 family transposase [Planctomycetes bacterium]|nr:ISAzo13 family transposase [Planctomycetota bacterium]